MKRIFIIMLVLLATIATAQEDVEAGITPDSGLYGLDRAMEAVRLAITKVSEKRAEVHLRHAEERLAELKEMIDENKEEYIEKLVRERERSINKSNEEVEKAKGEGKDVSELAAKVQEMHAKHIAVLEGLLEKVPEQAREHIQNAIEKSSRSRAVEAITKEKPVKAEAGKPEETPAGKGKLVMQITDKKSSLDITSLEVTISDIKVHIAGGGGTVECVNKTIIEENCTDEIVVNITTECVNETIIEEICENVTINITINETNLTNTTTVEECENETSIVENCTDVKVNATVEVCVNVTKIEEECSEESETESGWFTIVDGPVTYDLMEIKDVKELLGEKDLTAGKYTQIRLSVDSANLMIGNESKEIKIPSGKIKLVKNFNIVDGGTTTLTLDFDAEESVHMAGDKYIMKPRIKVIVES